MDNQAKRNRPAMLFWLCLIFAGAVASIAIAQSNSAFNLNSPASFPVDI